MFLNKEKITLLTAIGALLLTAYLSINGVTAIQLEVPNFASTVAHSDVGISEEVVINWWQMEKNASPESQYRDPFVAISEWAMAAADPLPLPPLEFLTRQIPLPHALTHSAYNRLPQERIRPEAQAEAEDNSKEGTK